MNIECIDDLIDLGVASVETQGNGGLSFDFIGPAPKVGICDE